MAGAMFPAGMRTRIAPTPSGFLHVGNGINFSAVWQLAKAYNGTVLLRIDDLDAERARPEYIDDIFRTLAWLGIEWHEGPTGPDDFRDHWSQHQRLERSVELLNALRQQGHLYACDCSRSSIAALAVDGRYPGTCRAGGRSLEDDDRSWRLNLERSNEVRFKEAGTEVRSIHLLSVVGDPVVRTKAGGSAPARPAYHMASLADDVHFGINTVVRGEDLLPSTALQVHVAAMLGLKGFAEATFLHHALSTDAAGRKLSKSEGANALRSWREAGRDPGPIHTAARSLLSARGLLPDAG